MFSIVNIFIMTSKITGSKSYSIWEWNQIEMKTKTTRIDVGKVYIQRTWRFLEFLSLLSNWVFVYFAKDPRKTKTMKIRFACEPGVQNTRNKNSYVLDSSSRKQSQLLDITWTIGSDCQSKGEKKMRISQLGSQRISFGEECVSSIIAWHFANCCDYV